MQTGNLGPVTVDEPAWCTTDHGAPQVFDIDISHFGPDIEIRVDSPRGPAEVLSLRLTQYPFTELPVGTAVHMSACLADGEGWDLDVAGLESLADQLAQGVHKVRYAARRLAAELSDVAGKGIDASRQLRADAPTLSSDVLDLLTAIHDALDVPLPGLAASDERAFQRLMEDRRSAIYSTLHSILGDGVQRINDHDARYIRRRTEATPVTYAVWQGLATDAEAGEGQ
ncbi:hypothetical protein V2S66_32935 [Streptomyces sp. V4-01]|uniref:Uncharacterized protein n=1 Tax=Actinacidiphila polyblastidii TaxID=3110430 RepID=A0ABU7PP26_9ACTN|nr:hypothetical protein [Streptomyces sp. V4-01]